MRIELTQVLPGLLLLLLLLFLGLNLRSMMSSIPAWSQSESAGGILITRILIY
jgi:hypothetical protein